jgi:hypothetical protein
LHAKTDREGRFEFRVGPGQYYLSGPEQIKGTKITVTDQAKLEFNFNAPREEKGLLNGLVVMGTPAIPVAGASVWGVYRGNSSGFDLSAKTDGQGRFEAVRNQHRMVLRAKSADGKLACIVEIGPDDTTVRLALVPVATARGRLLNSQTGEPDREIVYGVRVPQSEEKNSPWRTSYGGEVRTDSAGRFALTSLVAAQEYHVSVTLEERSGWQSVDTLGASPGETLDIGDVKLAPEFRRPTIAQSRREAFDVNGTPLERFENAQRDARLARLRVLVVLAPTKNRLTEQLFAMTRERDELSRTMDEFRTLWVATDDDRRAAAMALAKKLGRDLQEGGPVLVVADERGEPARIRMSSACKRTACWTWPKWPNFSKTPLPSIWTPISCSPMPWPRPKKRTSG